MALEIDTGTGLMPAHVWEPAGGSGPGLLLLQEIFGVSEYIKQRAEDLASLGYYVVAPEIYWRLDDVSLDEDAPDLLDRALEVMGRLDWSTAVSDSVAALDYLRSRETAVGVVGFCFGGGLGFNVAAASSPEVLVSYYGSALPNLLDLAPKVDAVSLHHFGDADDYLSPATVDQIVAAVNGPDNEIYRYPGAGHAFDNPMPAFHHPKAAALAWSRTESFLSRRLPTS
ncbi:carboxymethylenebutenolidase [Kribbella orskensis]|uniref:Carboxymethylenebutenolidase n=1 Tax=Kribbella orskensis TaxID=2512216 RepID=A0ABY2B8T8_9ACTN|nr:MULTISPECIES: dienelactone hydrolase family protein [Kribbella]TCN31026.1 carboxymethylenebutenolidase [Kribbella sp. VKM Ac-2500]TCO11561.1 carboxymethylenebutenolidase [Kribbella orskensis]